ncbi:MULTISPECIES: type II secretion system F family protein [Bacillaceae]|uniref:Type II secretion system F family protein n=1 Tax=Evansella alkalicola TaxID=745819 RepID=A0ABS6JRY3_9BACI|nr:MULTISPECIES: type II secretion system F family protein [Bacillaceae]MBU9721322.1 type II secretion system F family protein [Bacillus alkalicola]
MVLFSLWICSFIFFTSIGLLLLMRIYKNRIEIGKRIAPFLSTQKQQNLSDSKEVLENKSLYIRLFQPLVIKARQFVLGKMPKHKMNEIEKKLQAAGQPLRLGAGDFILLQMTLPVSIFLLFMILFAPTSEETVKIITLAGFVAVFVYGYMNYYLSAKSKQRTKLIEKGMPDFFDMLNVSIEAGMGLDSALKKVCSQMDSPLSKEFLSALEDMKLGKSRKEAFKELRDRVPSEFFKSVMSSLIQADQMGLGISKVLRTQTQRIREKQRFSAKEQAMKAPVKMLIPMVLFIFPTLFIVLLGPVVVNLVMQFL